MNEALRRKEFSSLGREVYSLVLYGMRKAPLPIHASIRAYSVLGIVVVLFFRCIAALLNSIHRREERIKWGLVTYTMVMFLLVTVGNTVHPYREVGRERRQRRIRPGESGCRESEFKSRCLYPTDTVLRR